jgi:hypothetical protein
MTFMKLNKDHVAILNISNPVHIDIVNSSGPDGIYFDVWYANKHLPRIQGHYPVGLRRYASPSRSAYFFIHEITDDQAQQFFNLENYVFDEEKPKTLSAHLSCIGTSLGGQKRTDAPKSVLDSAYAYPVFFNVSTDSFEEFDRWYSDEHLPMLLHCPQWLMCRRYKLFNLIDCSWTHVAIHYLADLRALQSPERDDARSTPWRKVLEKNKWFEPDYYVGQRVFDL